MAAYEIILAASISFAITSITLPYWMRRSREQNLLITDVQKIPNRQVPYLAGLIVCFSTILGTLLSVAYSTFIMNDTTATISLLAATSSLLISLIIGTVDDILGEKLGIAQKHKPILTLAAAIPMSVINAGKNIMTFPVIGAIELGNIYPFGIVLFGITGAANGFNMLAGVNGLEAGMATIILTALGYIAFAKEAGSAAVIISLCAASASFALFLKNKYPAKILPGNSFTYFAGTAIAITAILGDMERTAVILFTPYFIEFVLKARGAFKKKSLANPQKDGSLKSKYDKWYSLNHIAISILRKCKGKAYEWEITGLIFAFELVFVAIALLMNF